MNPFEFVPADVLPKVANLNSYILPILYKGENYHKDSTPRIIQAEHLPYLMKLRDEGIVALSMPVQDESDIAAIGIYNIANKTQVEEYVKKDPAVIPKVFNYQIINGIGSK